MSVIIVGVGTADGSGDGADDGIEVGEVVGTGVGSWVGASVGSRDGLTVGDCDSIPRACGISQSKTARG